MPSGMHIAEEAGDVALSRVGSSSLRIPAMTTIRSGA